MPANRRHRRAAVTLIELLVVLAVILIVGAVAIPTLGGFMRDTNVKGAADQCVARLADARGLAIDRGRPYRVTVSSDGLRIRLGPDDSEATTDAAADPTPAGNEESPLPKGVTLTPSGAVASTADGWSVLATYLPDGTCREPNAKFTLNELGVVPYEINVRGLTGAVTVNMVKGGS